MEKCVQEHLLPLRYLFYFLHRISLFLEAWKRWRRKQERSRKALESFPMISDFILFFDRTLKNYSFVKKLKKEKGQRFLSFLILFFTSLEIWKRQRGSRKSNENVEKITEKYGIFVDWIQNFFVFSSYFSSFLLLSYFDVFLFTFFDIYLFA